MFVATTIGNFTGGYVASSRRSLALAVDTLKDSVRVSWYSSNKLPALVDLSDSMTHTSVKNLIRMRRPLAILFGISSVVIDALKRHVFGSFAHVGKEVHEVRSPRITNSDTSPSITEVRSVFRVVTALHHSLPDFVFRSAIATMSSVKKSIMAWFTLSASAFTKVASFDDTNVSALAPTDPHGRTMRVVWSASKNRPLAESFSSVINKHSLSKLALHGAQWDHKVRGKK